MGEKAKEKELKGIRESVEGDKKERWKGGRGKRESVTRKNRE